jgi:hypothetical protein
MAPSIEESDRVRWNRHPSVVEIALTLAWLVWVLVHWSGVDPGDFWPPLLLYLGPIFLGVPWTLRMLVTLLQKPARLAAFAGPARIAAWLCLPLAMAVAWAAVERNFVMDVRLALSGSALSREMNAAPPGTHRSWDPPRRLGLVWIYALHAEQGCTSLVTSPPNACVQGLVHAPAGTPIVDVSGQPWRIRGPWWGFARSGMD